MSFKKLAMTEYFKNSILKRRREFFDREDDIIQWIDHPNHVQTQSDGRMRLYAKDVKTMKWVRIILLEDNKTIHNIFYDRDFEG